MRRLRSALGVAALLGVAWLVGGDAAGTGDAWRWQLPRDFPAPRVPADNPMSSVKVELGRRLFYDRRLSQNEQQSCASCHRQELAFTDGQRHAVGSTGETHVRNSMTLANVAYASRLTWANGLLDRLEDQALVPMFGDAPVELGLADERVLAGRLGADRAYRELFARAFPGDPEPVRTQNVARALAAFQRTLISADSPYDRYLRGASDALSPAAIRGMALFLSERLECFHCHGGFSFSDAVDHDRLAEPERAFHNTGLYDVDGRGAYPAEDRGLIAVTGRAEDMGRFKAPTLRNVAVTAPYMHDGSIATLEEVIDHYAAGGRTLASGPHAGSGYDSPRKDPLVAGFVITPDERRDLLAFLRSLTDPTFLTEPRFADPFAVPGSLASAERSN